VRVVMDFRDSMALGAVSMDGTVLDRGIRSITWREG
jgi:hypothetical protein